MFMTMDEAERSLLPKRQKKKKWTVADWVSCEPLTSGQKKSCVTCCVLLFVLIMVGDGIFLGFFFYGGDHHEPDDPYQAQCYLSPACTSIGPPDSNGYTNASGWTCSYSENCCEVCLPNTSATVCFDNDGSCANATGDGDFDYVMLDEMWIPQFCRALMNGYDPTLSHVEGMRCAYGSNELSIHGLWPNYVDGYPQCCNATGNLKPLNPAAVESWKIYSQLSNDWYDPTSVGSCGTCYLLNHEWEKHGNCYSPGEPEKYFRAGLYAYGELRSQNLKISSLYGTIVYTANITSLYSKNVNVMCDPNDPNSKFYLSLGIGILIEIQSCWNSQLNQIDCAPPFSGKFTVPCPGKVFIQTLLLYEEGTLAPPVKDLEQKHNVD